MEIKQIHAILDTALSETIGKQELTVEDLTNVVDSGFKLADIANKITNGNMVDAYVHSLINHIGKVIFDNRSYASRAPSILMDSWEYGSVVEKIRGELPESEDNPSYNLVNGKSYDPHVFTEPKAHTKFFNKKETYQIPMSFAKKQVKMSFSNATQLNAFFSMIENRIRVRKTIDIDNLIMRAINNFIGGTIYADYKTGTGTTMTDLGSKSGMRAINLLYLFNQQNILTTDLKASDCLFNLEFLKFASFVINRYISRIKDATTLFNVGGTVKFTPVNLQKCVLLSDFVQAAGSYLQSDTWHNEFTKLPSAETINFWQGTGREYGFSSISKINVTVLDPTAAEGTTPGKVTIATDGILGVIFDRDAVGVSNVEDYATSERNNLAEFTNTWYKYEASYFNDFDENGVVFFVKDAPAAG